MAAASSLLMLAPHLSHTPALNSLATLATTLPRWSQAGRDSSTPTTWTWSPDSVRKVRRSAMASVPRVGMVGQAVVLGAVRAAVAAHAAAQVRLAQQVRLVRVGRGLR